jgi:hypothetical protein
MTFRERVIEAALAVYRRIVSPALHAIAGAPGACRFQPTCSEYAAIALHEHGLLRGGFMAIGRVLRCNPFHKGGFDPVPLRKMPFTQYSSHAGTIEAGASEKNSECFRKETGASGKCSVGSIGL